VQNYPYFVKHFEPI